MENQQYKEIKKSSTIITGKDKGEKKINNKNYNLHKEKTEHHKDNTQKHISIQDWITKVVAKVDQKTFQCTGIEKGEQKIIKTDHDDDEDNTNDGEICRVPTNIEESQLDTSISIEIQQDIG